MSIISEDQGVSTLDVVSHVGGNNQLGSFLSDWDEEYLDRSRKIPLFNPEHSAKLDKSQQQFFTRVLYHLRGHFAEFLWYMGSFATDKESKELVLGNIRDEFGGNGLSHEKLYLVFAECLGVDLSNELLEEKWYLPFARDYIAAQLQWLRDHNSEERLAVFAAIERLDNIDYVNLRNIATSFGLAGKALCFFNVHINADHFNSILELPSFLGIWNKNSAMVKEIFNFVTEFQINMWQTFSEAVFNYKE